MAAYSITEYRDWLKELKNKVRSAQIKAALAVNAELIRFYWELGKMIAEKQSLSQWGDKLIEQVSTDLQEEFPDIKGLSSSNLKYCQRFYSFYQDTIEQQAVDQWPNELPDKVPWDLNILIFIKSGSLKEATYYLQQTMENNWGRDTLALQLNFYLSAVDRMVKQKEDNPTIGILFCRDKNNIEAEFALRDINKPMAVSEFELLEQLPDNLKSNLLFVEEIEAELRKKEA